MKIPIIKLVEKETGYHFDISVNVESGINSAKIMEKFIESSGYGQAIVALVLVIKQFLAQRYMNEVYSGGLGSYSVFILVTNFIMVIYIYFIFIYLFIIIIIIIIINILIIIIYV